MKNKIKKKEMDWSKLIFCNRHCLAFITIIVFLLIYGGVAHAEEGDIGQNDNAYTSVSLYEGLEIQENTRPKLYIENMATLYNTTTGGSINNVTGGRSAFNSRYVSDSVWNRGIFPTSVTLNNVTAVFDSSCPYFNMYAEPNGIMFSYRVMGNGNIALTANNDRGHPTIISDQPFTLGYVMSYSSNSWGRVGIVNVSTVNSNSGKYQYTPWGQDAYVVVSNIPIYLPSTDGKSGFSQQNYSDLSFEAENFDFNEQLFNGTVIEPSTPEVESDAKYNLTFRDNTYYSGDGLNVFWHNNNFTFTEYQINNPVNYRLKFSYKVEFANNLGVDDTYYYTPSDDVQLAYFLGQSNRLGTGSRIAVPLSSDWFKNGSNQTLTSAIVSTINAVTGTDVQYVNPNGLFENIIDWAVTVDNYVFGDGSGSPLQVVTNRYDGTITKFKIYGEVSLYNDVNSNYESYSYKDSHNFLTGNGQVISTDNTVAPYEDSPAPVYTTIPSTGSGSGGVSAGAGSAVATIQKGAIQITNTLGGNGGAGFQMPQESWNNFGGLLLEMRNDLTTLESDNGILSTMQCIQNVTSLALPTEADGSPNRLWILMYAGVAGSIAIALWNKAAHNH